MKKLIFATFLVLIHLFSYAQNGILYKISGNNLAKPSYIFGTIHMICKDDFKISDTAINLLKNADELMLEVNLSDTKQLMDMQKEMSGGKPFVKSLNSKELKLFKQSIKKMGFEYEDVSELPQTMVFQMLMMKYLPCEANDLKMYEMDFIKLAKSFKKNINGLEEAGFQSKMLEKFINKTEVLKNLNEFEKGKSQFLELIKNYKTEDIVALDKLMNNPKQMKPEQLKAMLIDRNLNWISLMPNQMQEKSIFYAVGAGHLGGKNGVLQLLKNKGFQVEKVK